MFLLTAGIFIPETRRYFLSSHSGLWKICRYALIPQVLANSTAARNFTTLSYTNQTQIDKLKKTISSSNFVHSLDLNDETAAVVNGSAVIDENFRRLLFTYWVQNQTVKFRELKDMYKFAVENSPDLTATGGVTKTKPGGTFMLNPTNVTALTEIIGGAMTTVEVNNTYLNVIVPETLRNALFSGWEEHPDIIYLLWSFAKDMDIPPHMVTPNGTKLIIKPPPRPSSKIHNGYDYKEFSKFIKIYNCELIKINDILSERCKFHEMFVAEDSNYVDPAADEELISKKLNISIPI